MVVVPASGERSRRVFSKEEITLAINLLRLDDIARWNRFSELETCNRDMTEAEETEWRDLARWVKQTNNRNKLAHSVVEAVGLWMEIRAEIRRY
jgi:hypothetical protein